MNAPRSDSVEIMVAIDRMPKGFRALVHEFGYVMVREMIAFGATDAKNLRRDLEGWRVRRQMEWTGT